jgi:hypothetical protein
MHDDLDSVMRSLARLIDAQNRGTWNHLHTVILLLTLAVLVWYTIETYRLRRVAQDQILETTKLLKEAQRQNEVSDNLLQEAQRRNEVSVMPIMAVATEPAAGDAVRIVLLNVGSGPAFNVSIDRVEWDGRELHVELDRSVLRSGEAKELLLYFRQRESGSLLDNQSLALWLGASRIPNPLHIKIRCNSVDSKPYVFHCSLTCLAGKLRITYDGRASGDDVPAQQLPGQFPPRVLV